jgi:hypothetical protein
MSNLMPLITERTMQEDAATTPVRMPLLFGVLLPIVAVVADPYVFKGNGIFSHWSGAGYALIAIGIGSMTYWLLRRSAHPFLAGTFAVCSFLSWVIAILLFPVSLVGIVLFGIGLLGFIPFSTAYVFCRSTLDVWRQSSRSRYRALNFVIAIVTVVLALFASQKTVELMVEKATAVFARESEQMSQAEEILLLGAAPFGLQKHVVAAWRMEKDAGRARQMAARYEARYGTKIAHDEIMFFD